MDAWTQLVKNIPWNTLPPWAVLGAIAIVVIGPCAWAYIRSRKKPSTDVSLGSGNKRVEADVGGSTRLKMGNKNEDVKIVARDKR
jgi:hypothetical protein